MGSRLVVKCVRSTTSLAVTMDLALGQVILLLVVSSLVGASSETLKVSSTGDAAKKQETKMGDYMSTSKTKHGHPVYEKTNGHKNFLYVSSNGFWTVGSVVGSTTSGIYNSQFPTPSLPPTSGWRYLDGKEWKEDATLKVESKTAPPAGVPAVDQSVLGLEPGDLLLERQLLLRLLFAQPGVAPQAPVPRSKEPEPKPKTVVSKEAEPKPKQVVSPAAACPLKIQVRIDSDDGLPTNTDSGQAANRYAGKGNNGLASVLTQDYRGTYTRSDFEDAHGHSTYTHIANPAITISRVTTVTGTQWQMNGGTSGAASTTNAIQGTTVPAGTTAGRTCSTAYPPKDNTASSASPNTNVLCNLNGPHLIINSGDSCPPESGWLFKVGPTEKTAPAKAKGAGAGSFKKAASVRVTALP